MLPWFDRTLPLPPRRQPGLRVTADVGTFGVATPATSANQNQWYAGVSRRGAQAPMKTARQRRPSKSWLPWPASPKDPTSALARGYKAVFRRWARVGQADDFDLAILVDPYG